MIVHFSEHIDSEIFSFGEGEVHNKLKNLIFFKYITIYIFK